MEPSDDAAESSASWWGRGLSAVLGVSVALPGGAIVAPILLVGVVLGLVVMCVGVTLAQSMLTWPVATPRDAQGATPYRAAGWRVAIPYGWVAEPGGRYRLHEGITLVGEAICPGCPVAPMADVVVPPDGVQWDPESADPWRQGAGVVVTVEVQHPAESGGMDGAPLMVRYGHLHPYRVFLRTQVCQQQVSCPIYEPTDQGIVTVQCAGPLVALPAPFGEYAYAYATPGQCRAQVVWPAGWTPVGPVAVTFDQQIVPGVAAADAAISFRAQAPPPPPTPTPLPPLPTPTPGSMGPPAMPTLTPTPTPPGTP